MLQVRWVRTTSGAVAVQVGHASRSRWTIVHHFGSAHNDEELALLWDQAVDFVDREQPSLDGLSDLRSEPPGGLFDDSASLRQEALPIDDLATPGIVSNKSGNASPEEIGGSSGGRIVATGSASELLCSGLRQAYARLGFGQVGDAVFEQVVLARIVEPTSKADTPRVLSDPQGNTRRRG